MNKSKYSIKHLWCFTFVCEFMKYMFNFQNTSLQQFHGDKNHHTNAVSRNTPRFQWVKGTQRLSNCCLLQHLPGQSRDGIRGDVRALLLWSPRMVCAVQRWSQASWTEFFGRFSWPHDALPQLKPFSPISRLIETGKKKKKRTLVRFLRRNADQCYRFLICYLPIPPQSHH